jgi:putative transcriptional regulator
MKNIHLNLRKLAKAAGIKNAHQLVKATGFSVSTAYALWTEKAQGIEFATLDKLCQVLNCQPGDLLSQRNGKVK